MRASKGVLKFGATIEGVFSVVNRGGLEIVAHALGVQCKYLFDLDEITGDSNG